MFGVDEAGRGPVLGSMFVACVSGPENAFPDGVDDSKKLTKGKIQQIATDIVEHPSLDTSVVEVTPTEIDEGESMTVVSADAYARSIDDIVSEDCFGIIDSFQRDENAASNKVCSRCDTTVDINSECGADEKYAHVSAASVVAKNARERHIDSLKEKFGEIGSGYPSDGTTRQYLEDFVSTNGHLPPCARSSWKTSQSVLDSEL